MENNVVCANLDDVTESHLAHELGWLSVGDRHWCPRCVIRMNQVVEDGAEYLANHGKIDDWYLSLGHGDLAIMRQWMEIVSGKHGRRQGLAMAISKFIDRE